MTAPIKAGGKEVKIGELRLTSDLFRSKWGDDKMFFRHQKMDDDLKFNPAWEPFVARYSLDGKCPFGY